MRVFVYFNLHKKLFSIKAMEGPNRGRVIHHSKGVRLSDVKFKVSEKGRQRVLTEKRKNVHAGVVGTLIGLFDSTDEVGGNRVTYNPYKCDSFVRAETFEPVYVADNATLFDRQVYVK